MQTPRQASVPAELLLPVGHPVLAAACGPLVASSAPGQQQQNPGAFTYIKVLKYYYCICICICVYIAARTRTHPTHCSPHSHPPFPTGRTPIPRPPFPRFAIIKDVKRKKKEERERKGYVYYYTKRKFTNSPWQNHLSEAGSVVNPYWIHTHTS
jgi:hypothetical protein